MYILLVGCTGYLGKAMIHWFITHTKHTLFLIIRQKNGLTIRERLFNILAELDLEYTNRIIPIEVSYDDTRQIIMKEMDRNRIQEEAEIIINALADVKFNRSIQKAVLNNTVTALNWMRFFKKCAKSKKYIYVSSALINFHITKHGTIKEKIYETHMTETTLVKILGGEKIAYAPYHNTYLYSKQLSEILLLHNKEHLSLAIFRPSGICPAVEFPYCGWGTMQTLNYILFGIGTGLIPYWNISRENIFTNNMNIVPVDIAARDCISMIRSKKSFEIRHSCFTGNNPHVMTYFTFYLYTQKAYRYYKDHPLSLGNHTFKPHYPFYLKDHNSLYCLILLIYHLKDRYTSRKDFFHFLKMLKISFKLTQNLNTYLPHFISKKVIFERSNKKKWFYKEYPMEKSYKIFIENLDYIIKNDPSLIRLFS